MSNKEKWENLADEIRKINYKLLKISVDKENVDLVNGKTRMRDLYKALDYISRFRDKAEEEMFKQGIEDLNIWFGDKGSD